MDIEKAIMQEKFTIEKWFQVSFQILKKNWIQWIVISAITTVILSAIFYFLFQEIGLLILQISSKPEDYKQILLTQAHKTGLLVLSALLVLNFIDLYMIHTTSQWYSEKMLTVEETFLKVLSAMPVSIILTIIYILMTTISLFFCIIPVIFVIVYFLFIFQALIIEDRSFGSLGRSIELVKPNFGILVVLPFVISLGLQFTNSLPFYLIQLIVENFIGQTITPEMSSREVFEFLIKSPYILFISAPWILFFSLQSNLKSILYTVAFEQARQIDPTKE